MTIIRRMKKRFPIGIQRFLAGIVRFFRELPFLAGDLKEVRNILSEIGCNSSQRQRIWYFAVPLHSNLGDQAQYICIKEWLAYTFPKVPAICIPTRIFLRVPFLFLRRMKKVLQTGDIIVFQSGYTMTDFHPDEVVRRQVLGKFSQNLTLIFPQTILYQSKKSERLSANLLCRCPKLLLLARDAVSLKAAESFCPNQCAYWPDMVTSWIGMYTSPAPHSGILFCIRQDGESSLDSQERERIFCFLETLAPTELCGTEASSRSSDWKEESIALIRRFSQAQLVVTDRYHGMLFALAAGVPVAVLPAHGHKLSSGADQLAALCPGYVRTAANEAELRTAVQELLKGEPPPLPQMNSFHSDLLQLITNRKNLKFICQAPFER